MVWAQATLNVMLGGALKRNCPKLLTVALVSLLVRAECVRQHNKVAIILGIIFSLSLGFLLWADLVSDWLIVLPAGVHYDDFKLQPGSHIPCTYNSFLCVFSTGVDWDFHLKLPGGHNHCMGNLLSQLNSTSTRVESDKVIGWPTTTHPQKLLRHFQATQ